MEHDARIKELQGRINAIEGMATAALAIMLSQAPNDPDKSKAVALLKFIRQAVIERIPETNSQDCESETRAALDDILSKVSEHIDLLRPKPRQ